MAILRVLSRVSNGPFVWSIDSSYRNYYNADIRHLPRYTLVLGAYDVAGSARGNWGAIDFHTMA